ncbi:MAG: glucosaminidase domain-containing protein [Chitinophagales bacterium]
MTAEEYINKHYPLAVQEMNLYKVPASITLAQGLIETESGNSLLATKANNHFGIKCKTEWTGVTFIKDDDTKNECFRSYGTAEESYRDHSIFLLKPRYSILFSYDMTDYRSWAYGLKQAGYATNPNYPTMLIKYIEDFKLFQFDNYGLEKAIVSAPKPDEKPKPKLSLAELIKLRRELANNLDLVIVDESFDIYKLASNKNQSVGFLMEINDLEGEQPIRMGQNFFLEKKGKMNLKDKHTVLIGESLYDISQMYGVGLKLLRKYNKLETWEQPAVGETIYLSKLRDDFIKTRPFYQVYMERMDKNLELFIPIKLPKEISPKIDTPIPAEPKNIAVLEMPEVKQTIPAATQIEPPKIKIDTPLTPIVRHVGAPPIQIEPMDTIPSKGNQVWINHQVKPKETIFKISKFYECKPNEILNWNGLTIEQGLKIGQVLRIFTIHPKGLVSDLPPVKEEIIPEPPTFSKLKATKTSKLPLPTTKTSSAQTAQITIADSAKTPILKIETTIDTKAPTLPPAIKKTEAPVTTKPAAAKVIKTEPAIAPIETNKKSPKEPQKPRIVILRAPAAAPTKSKENSVNTEKSNISDLYKSIMKDTEADTSIKRRIKVSE